MSFVNDQKLKKKMKNIVPTIALKKALSERKQKCSRIIKVDT